MQICQNTQSGHGRRTKTLKGHSHAEAAVEACLSAYLPHYLYLSLSLCLSVFPALTAELNEIKLRIRRVRPLKSSALKRLPVLPQKGISIAVFNGLQHKAGSSRLANTHTHTHTGTFTHIHAVAKPKRAAM